MNRTWLVFLHELLGAIRRAGFIVMTLIVPVLALLAIGIAAEDDASAPPGGEFGFLLRILHRNAPVKHVLKYNPHGS